MNFFDFVLGPLSILIQLYVDKFEKADLDATLTELMGDANFPRIKTYDFIIVGGGASGSVLANRLSVNFSVLLLEAGGSPPPATETLVPFGHVIQNDFLQYEFRSIPQVNTSHDTDGIMTQRPGRMLGGSSSHNAYVFNRGHPRDFDAWAEISNDPSWKYENLLQYFKKSEHFVGSGPSDQHGLNGPMNIETFEDESLSAWLAAGRELGFDTYDDPNGPQRQGFSPIQMTRYNGRRVSPYTAYLKPIENTRGNLKVERYSPVDEILFDEDKRAYGVAYHRHKFPQLAHASKEIIISAGAFGSPILLMKSGIGPSSDLEEAGIPVISNLPVGVGSVEHFGIELAPFKVANDSIFPKLEEQLTEASLIQFHESNGSGYLSRPLTGAQALLVSTRAKLDAQPDWPDIQIDFEMGISGSFISNFNLSVLVGLNRPKSKGTIKINSTAYRAGKRSAEDLAIVDYNWMSDSSDAAVLVEGIMIGLEIFEGTDAFRPYGVEYSGVQHPNCTQHEFRSVEYWHCHIRQFTFPLNHCTSTCSFGNGDRNAVLDSKLNVIGVSSLKVVDGSIMPIPVNSNPTAAIVMIAEKAADEIIKSYALRAKN